MELPWNTTRLRGVFICFAQVDRIAMEKVFRENSMEYSTMYFHGKFFYGIFMKDFPQKVSLRIPWRIYLKTLFCRIATFFRYLVHKQTNKQVHPSSGTALYPHMPRASIADRCQFPPMTANAPSVEGTGVDRQYLPAYADFGILGEQSSPKWQIPCPGCPWTTLQNLTPLALFLPGKSVTVQTNKNKQTKTHGVETWPSLKLRQR